MSMFRTMAVWLVGASTLCAPGWERRLWADDAAASRESTLSADDLLGRGVALREEEKDADALEVFEQAYRMAPSAHALAQVALAHQALGHWVEAERDLTQSLLGNGDPWIERQRPLLEQGLATIREHLGWLDVRSNLATAEVWTAGSRAGTLPLPHPLRVASGQVLVEVRGGDGRAETRLVDVPAGGDGRAWVEFEAREAARPKRTPSEPRNAGWITLGASGTLLLAGAAGLAVREVEARIYDDAARCGPTVYETRYERCGANRDVGTTAGNVGAVLLGASAVGFGVSTWLLLRAPRPPVPAQATTCGLRGAGFWCEGSF